MIKIQKVFGDFLRKSDLDVIRLRMTLAISRKLWYHIDTEGGNKMKKSINFDMDGTIADLYGVEGWLEDLLHEDVRPYAEARPLVNLQRLARLLNKLIREGYSVNVISWTSRNGSAEYNRAVAKVKIQWLETHLHSVKFSRIEILPYGTPKELFGEGILFDDEEHNRESWGEGAYTEKEIFEVLKNL